MGKVIAVMKQHGFHEPAAVSPWKPDEHDPLIVEARSLGIDVERTIHAGGNPLAHKAWSSALKSEIRAVKEARKNPWDILEDSNLRQRVRAIQAEKKANDLWHEVGMLKQRLKQADNGKSDWVDERDALLTEIDSLRRKLDEPKTEEESVVTQSLRAQVNALEQALEKAKRGYDETAKAIANENTELHGKLAEWEGLLEELKQAVTNWETSFQEEHQAYLAVLAERDAIKIQMDAQDNDIKQDYNVIQGLQAELAGYKEANSTLRMQRDSLYEQLQNAASAGAKREAPADEVAWLRSRVEYLEGKLR